MKKHFFFYCLIGLLLGACQTAEQQEIPKQNAFFDLTTYFEAQAEALSQKQSFKKTTQINGKRESHTFETLNFTNELAVFIDSDINRIAWLDQYQVDSTLAADGSLASISYEALNPKLQTRKLQIDFNQNQPSVISINRLMENALMNASMQLEYRPEKSYRIQSNQKLRLSEEREMIVSVEF